MSIKTIDQLENTRAKLGLLEDRLQALSEEPGADTIARSWTVRSLKRLVHQMKEEITRFESHAKASKDR
jgi:hypothetical protein